MRVGARVLKTGLAVALATYVSAWLGMPVGTYAALAAVLTLQPSVFRSWKYLLEQVQANLIGVTLAALGVLLLGNHPIVTGLVVILVIAINLKLKLEKSLNMAVFVVIIVMESSKGNYLPFAALRFEAVMVGIFCAMAINALFLPPKYENSLVKQVKDARDRISLLLRNLIPQEIRVYHEEKKKAKQSLEKAEELFKRFQEERYWFQQPPRKKAYQLVLFRRMINALHKEMDVMRTIERHLSTFALIRPDLLANVQQHILSLTTYHEKLIAQYDGVLVQREPYETKEKVRVSNRELISDLLTLYDTHKHIDEDTWFQFFPVIAALSELTEQLHHLDRLTHVYCRYHR